MEDDVVDPGPERVKRGCSNSMLSSSVRVAGTEMCEILVPTPPSLTTSHVAVSSSGSLEEAVGREELWLDERVLI